MTTSETLWNTCILTLSSQDKAKKEHLIRQRPCAVSFILFPPSPFPHVYPVAVILLYLRFLNMLPLKILLTQSTNAVDIESIFCNCWLWTPGRRAKWVRRHYGVSQRALCVCVWVSEFVCVLRIKSRGHWKYLISRLFERGCADEQSKKHCHCKEILSYHRHWVLCLY